MRILVLTNQVPFAFGGAEIHAHSLVSALRRAGHEAEEVAIPFKWYPPEKILDHLLACRLLDVTASSGVPVDRVIGLRFPAYHIPHPNKVLWILHQYRTAFDLWDQPECDLSRFAIGREVREAIEQAERSLLPEARAIYANSANVAHRLEKYCGIHSEPLYHPPKNAESFYCDGAEDYLFLPSRFSTLKRQELVLRALARTRQPVRVIFSGKADNPAYLEELKNLAHKLRVDRRVDWLGLISDEEMLRLYSRALAIIFPPKDEDYGYITLEGMLSSKAIITCTDSGGPLEFVEQESTGLIAEPTEESLAAAMDRIWKDRTFAREAGMRGRIRLDALGVNWETVVSKLLA